MEALVLERKDELNLRDFPVEEMLGSRDVRIAPRTVGVCGSDVHYYTHGAIGPFVVKEPMILGHEAAGQVVEVGSAVTELKPGDRVCMEPGIPDPASRATRLGKYNLDPAVRFWATRRCMGCSGRPWFTRPTSPSSSRIMSPTPRVPWWSPWLWACTPPPRFRCSQATWPL